MQVLCTRSNQEIQEIAAAYEASFGQSLESAIQNEVTGDYRSLLTLLLTVCLRVSFNYGSVVLTNNKILLYFAELVTIDFGNI
jgi:hypothetical protein